MSFYTINQWKGNAYEKQDICEEQMRTETIFLLQHR